MINLKHLDGNIYFKTHFFHRDEIDELEYSYEKKERGRGRVRIKIQKIATTVNDYF